MFSMIYRRKTDVEGRREEMYNLFAKAPEEVTEADLGAIKATVEADNTADPGGKNYRETSTALSLLLFLGKERFPAALAAVFPDRGDTAEAILDFRDFVDKAGTRPNKGEEKDFYDQAKAVGENLQSWPTMGLMAKQYTINALLRVRDFFSVQTMIRELCGEMVAMDDADRRMVVDLCNEFSGV